jgi:hypothetical protein
VSGQRGGLQQLFGAAGAGWLQDDCGYPDGAGQQTGATGCAGQHGTQHGWYATGVGARHDEHHRSHMLQQPVDSITATNAAHLTRRLPGMALLPH